MIAFQYRGYVAEVVYDGEADLHCGSVVNTEPYSIVAFELPDGLDVYQEFQTSVDVYLASCEEDGVEPLPPLPYLGELKGDYEPESIGETEVVHP